MDRQSDRSERSEKKRRREEELFRNERGDEQRQRERETEQSGLCARVVSVHPHRG